MALLCLARLAIQLVPFRYWRGTLGRVDARAAGGSSGDRSHPPGAASRLAVQINHGAARLPFASNCLPRAMALCWLLRLGGIAYRFKIAARPADVRQAMSADDDSTLHTWVEVDRAVVIGALPGPWLVVLELGQPARSR